MQTSSLIYNRPSLEYTSRVPQYILAPGIYSTHLLANLDTTDGAKHPLDVTWFLVSCVG